MSVSVKEEGVINVITLHFSKAFDTVLQDIPLVIYGLERWVLRYVENWVSYRA